MLWPVYRELKITNQKWKVPSDPAVENVPYVGWKDIALTLKTFTFGDPAGVSRWHLNEKFALEIGAKISATRGT